MSAKHPTPWTIEECDNGKRGKLRSEWAYILDARGVYVVDGMDLSTAREIAEAVNGRAALRDIVRPVDPACGTGAYLTMNPPLCEAAKTL